MAEIEPGVNLSSVLAEYFECDPAEIRGYVIGCERQAGDNLVFTTVWSINTPDWQLAGFADEIKRSLDSNRSHENNSDNGRAEL
jgi:hypothetical protein